MTNPSLTAPSFASALADLLPVGTLWPRDPDTVLMALVAALADGANAVHQRGQDLLVTESDPAQAIETLPDWERAFGLPDACVGEGQTVQERQAALVARIAATGGQSRAYFIAVAAALGYPITIEEFRPFRADRSTADTPLNDMPWPFTWRVHAPAQTIIYFRADRSAAGEPLERATDLVLECVLRRLAPAHTNVLFAYGS